MTEKEYLEIIRNNPDISVHNLNANEKVIGTYHPSQDKTTEHDEQVMLFRWAEQNLDRWDGVLAYMFSIPNGGQRHVAVAGKLKAEGVKPGVPDVFLPVSSGSYHGLFIEMKVGKNRPTDNQVRWIKRLRKLGHRAVVCYSADEAIEIVKEYLGGE